ncbi:Glycosyltransferase 2-like [Acidimicrobiia bacterium]
MRHTDRTDFDEAFYRATYEDLQHLDSQALFDHWTQTGKSEGRRGSPDQEMPIVELGQAFITRSEWVERAAALRTNAQFPDGRQTFTSWMRTSDSTTGPAVRSLSAPRAAILSSLYRSIDYLDAYLGNLAEQTVFAECDVCIVSVDPVDGERELINAFADAFANVRVYLSDKRIGIYEAWNIAASMSDAPYLTNANADDLRGRRSLEVQIAGLDQNPHVDVVFQDMYLTLDPSMNWEQIVAMGLRTDFPDATLSTLLNGLNVPHCGPMWRRRLHDELGGFDESFESAADWEFWIRCAVAGKTFLKLDEPTVSYFINGEGMSRRKDGPGYTEPAMVLERYRHLL